ncbi:hypothetical protein QSI_4110 [Clostridioides difficile P28]|nr:hypothetical protein QSI_4110 [Clostridioides difficile P28]
MRLYECCFFIYLLEKISQNAAYMRCDVPLYIFLFSLQLASVS